MEPPRDPRGLVKTPATRPPVDTAEGVEGQAPHGAGRALGRGNQSWPDDCSRRTVRARNCCSFGRMKVVATPLLGFGSCRCRTRAAGTGNEKHPAAPRS